MIALIMLLCLFYVLLQTANNILVNNGKIQVFNSTHYGLLSLNFILYSCNAFLQWITTFMKTVTRDYGTLIPQRKATVELELSRLEH